MVEVYIQHLRDAKTELTLQGQLRLFTMSKHGYGAASDQRAQGIAASIQTRFIMLINQEYHRNIGIIRSHLSLAEWTELLKRTLGDDVPYNVIEAWRMSIARFFTDFDRSAAGVAEGEFLILLIERLTAELQRRWYIDGLGREEAHAVVDTESIQKYQRPRLPGTLVPPSASSVLPFHTV